MLVAVGVISMPLTWRPIVVEVGEHGQGGVIGELYPVLVTGAAVAGALALLLAAMCGQRGPLAAWCMVVGGVAMAAFMVALRGGLSLPA